MFFTPDHGEFTGSHRLNDKGPAMYDDIYRIPFIARIPGLPQGQKCDEYVSLIDIPATVLDIAGLDTSKVEDGHSLIPLAAGKKVDDWRGNIVCEFHGHHFPLQQRMIRTDDYKLIVSHESINELYDLKQDPWELNNVYKAPAYDDVRRKLALELYTQLNERGDTTFAKWMAAMTDFDVALTSTAKSDWDDVAD
jgi:arylsulfatase A-like enzyme